MIKEKMKQLVGKSIKAYDNEYSKPKIDELKFKEQYQGRIIDCMVGEVDDNYIETPETDAPIVKLEHSKEGIVKIPSIKGKTILVDSEGNETDTPGEGCRLISVGESEDNRLLISSNNRNLFTNVKTGKYYGGAGDLVSEPDSSYSEDYIKVKKGEIFIANHLNSSVQIMEYDINKNLIQRVNQIPTAYIVPNKVEFIRLSFYRLNTILNNEFQFERGNTRTTYVEPKQHKTEILLKKPLMKLDNSIYDEIVGNKIIRRCKLVNLDDRHCSTLSIKPPSGRKSYYISLVPYGFPNYPIPSFASNKVLLSDSTEIGILTGTNNANPPYFGFHMDENKFPTVEEVKEYLRENNIQLLVSVKEPIIEELPNSITLQGFDDTTMYIENSITPTVSYGYNALIPYKQELLNQQEEVEVNTLDIENNIIPYLMDMEYNLMLMEDN